jgi:hypothetical protein
MTTDVTDRSMSRCDNCQQVWPEDQLNEPSHLWERLDAGSEVPSGECPECGCLCYLITSEEVEEPRK